MRASPQTLLRSDAAAAYAPAADMYGARLARQAYDLTSDLMRPDPKVYWFDLAVTTLAVYAGLYLAVAAPSLALRAAAGLVSVFALYRGLSFIHELTHLRPGEVPGFNTAWNILIGVPFLAPSFLYEGVHNLHHGKDRYGTARDPEYLPLARYSAGRILGFVAVSLLAPLGVAIRFAVATPASFLSPRLRRFVVARASAMTINPGFAREDLQRGKAAPWLAQEIACWLWSWTILGLALSGALSARFLIVPATLAVATFINQLRTASAHYWNSQGEPMSFIEQFSDSVNVPPPALLPALWAPVGLRYHGLHHLAPRLPYHNLGEAHRRLGLLLPAHSAYHAVAQKNLSQALRGLFLRASTNRRERALQAPPAR